MKILLTSLFIFISAVAFSTEITLKEKLAEAFPGSYLVTEQNKNFTFLHVFEKKDNVIVLEEVVIPASRFPKQAYTWKEWFEAGAPGHTAWTLTQINTQSGTLEEIFSFTHNGWVDVSQADSFMTTLLNLRFKEVPYNERRRIGLPPGYGKPDHRQIWNPRLIVNGTPLENVSFDVWKARWPCDGSELSRKVIEAYLPEASPSMAYPIYFPYWLEVEGKIGSAKVRVVDSGMEAHSPKPHLPKRVPQFTGKGSLEENGLAIELKSPAYFQDFIVIAEESDTFLGKTFVLPCQTTVNDGITKLFISRDELDKCLVPGERYRFSISPKEDPSLFIETVALLYSARDSTQSNRSACG